MSIIKTTCGILLCFFAALPLFAQQTDNKEKPVLDFSGFIKNDIWYDSRKVKGSREDLFLFYPENKMLDYNGKDLNAHPQFHILGITSRLTAKITAANILKAKSTSIIEADFSGVSNFDINGFRLRHAFTRLNWQNDELLIGQYWHPLFTTDLVPDVASLNTGAPFQPFIRNPQITYTRKINHFHVLVSAITQRDHASTGPKGVSPVYIRNAIMPNLHTQVKFNFHNHLAGIGADYKCIMPANLTDSMLATNEKLCTYAFTAFYKFAKPGFCFRFKSIYGQNLSEHLLLGGYAIKNYDTASGKATYTSDNHLFLWANAVYGSQWQFGLFCGYAHFLGTSHNNTGIHYSLLSSDANIQYLYRIAPCVSYNCQKFKAMAEVENTTAAYGTPDKNDKSLVKDAQHVSNVRLLLTILYFF